MRRILSILLATALTATLAACGSSGATLPQREHTDMKTEVLSMERENSPAAEAAQYTPVFPRHAPYGTGIGVKPGRVVWAYDPDSVDWDGFGYWWQPEHFDEAVMGRMVSDGIATLAGVSDAQAGWDALFRAHNTSSGGQGGYQAGQKIAIKVNMNGSGAYSDDTKGETHESYTNPVLLRTLLSSLVLEAGVAPHDITVYDAGRVIPDYMQALCSARPLAGVQFQYRDLLGAHDAQPDRNVPVVWSQSVSGDTNYLPTCVTEADYLINLANLKGHVYGITLGAKNHYGSIMNSDRMRAPEAAGVHRYLTQNRMDAYTVLVDLMANHQLGEKTMLYLLDAVICAPGESVPITGENARWQQAPFSGDYTSSVFFSQDPVALDSVGADFLMNEPTVTSRNSALRENPNVENYLHEAGLVADAPSGTAYYNGNGQRVTNLGVHEHWNEPVNKQYSRNLGGREGIELVRLGADSGGAQTPDAQTQFADFPANAWYADAVAYCRDRGLMSGTTSTTFSPNATTSRAMLATILYRQAGSPVTAQDDHFSDVETGSWYSSAAVWASANGIITGYSDGRFGPNDTVTREQIATILWRAAGTPAAGQGVAFADESSVSPFATQAVDWARGNGIISGKEGNRFDPKGNATRAEVAAILHRYLGSDSSTGVLLPEDGVPQVYMTTDISAEGLMTVYRALGVSPDGNHVAVKLSTGEPGSNYLKPALIQDLVREVNGTIVECNTAYGGSRANTAMHYQVAEDHGYTTIADVDIMDEDGSIALPVSGGTNLGENYVGTHFSDYDYFVVLSHFKGHSMAGFGGAIKNSSIGIASAQGKSWIHSGGTQTSGFGGEQDAFLESMAEAGKSVVDALDGNILYINVMNRLSVDCDCDGNPTAPDMHDIGILSSTDPVALDQACVDLVYAAADGASLIRRMESRNGLHTLEHADTIGLGSRDYTLVRTDNEKE